jgi:hypothetical protein
MVSRGGKTKEEHHKITNGYLWVRVQFVGLNTPVPFRKFTVLQEKFLQKTKAENELFGLPKKRSMTIEITVRNTMSSSDLIKWHGLASEW